MCIEFFSWKKKTSEKKRGQVQMGVTLIIVFLFIVLLMFSLILYFRFAYSEMQETKEILLDQKYSALLSTIIGLPEFRCSRLGAEQECLDMAKINNIKEKVIDKNLKYYDGIFSGVKGIWVEVLDAEEARGYLGSEFEIYGSSEGEGLIYSVPVSLYYPDYKKYKIGILKIKGSL